MAREHSPGRAVLLPDVGKPAMDDGFVRRIGHLISSHDDHDIPLPADVLDVPVVRAVPDSSSPNQLQDPLLVQNLLQRRVHYEVVGQKLLEHCDIAVEKALAGYSTLWISVSHAAVSGPAAAGTTVEV
jgi:hypothetical protein